MNVYSAINSGLWGFLFGFLVKRREAASQAVLEKMPNDTGSEGYRRYKCWNMLHLWSYLFIDCGAAPCLEKIVRDWECT